jgi:hypothetical protein
LALCASRELLNNLPICLAERISTGDMMHQRSE